MVKQLGLLLVEWMGWEAYFLFSCSYDWWILPHPNLLYFFLVVFFKYIYIYILKIKFRYTQV